MAAGLAPGPRFRLSVLLDASYQMMDGEADDGLLKSVSCLTSGDSIPERRAAVTEKKMRTLR